VLVARNFLAGLSSSIWNAIVTLATVPFLLRFLGVEAYGLVGCFALMQSLLQVLDLGLASTINREVARCRTLNRMDSAAELLQSLALVYWTVGLLIFLVLATFSDFIASTWLNVDNIPQQSAAHAIMLIGLVIGCRWPLGLYQGALLGAEKLMISSALSAIMTSVANLGAIAVLAFVSPTIEAFFLWQAGVSLVYSLSMSWAAWRVVGREGRNGFSWQRVRSVWRFTAGMSLVAVTAIVLMQLDKAILSGILRLDEFGSYTLAVLIASALYVILRPLFNTIYPRMSGLVARNATEELTEFYMLGTRVLCAAMFPISLSIAFFSRELVELWVRDPALAARVAPLVSWLAIGTTLNGVMHFPYALQLASGATRLPLIINLALIAVCVPTTVVLALGYGALGGALAWMVVNAFYVGIGCYLTHRLLLRGEGLRWLTSAVLWPFLVSLATVGAGAAAIRQAGLSNVGVVACAAGVAAAACLVNLLLTSEVVPRLRRALA